MSNSERVWSVRPASSKARRQWEDACDQEPDLMAAVRERLQTRPLDRSDNPRRLGQLKGKLREKKVGDTKLPQWQYEITAGGRLWFCPDRNNRIVWVTKVSLSHPKETE
jgi:hypothetical protein